MDGSLVGFVVAVLIAAAILSSFVYIIKFSSAANEFDIWFPTNYQRTIVDRRNEARSGWLDLIRAVDEAKAKGLDPDLIKRLENARENARTELDMGEMEIRGERNQLGDPKRYDALLKRWGDAEGK